MSHHTGARLTVFPSHMMELTKYTRQASAVQTPYMHVPTFRDSRCHKRGITDKVSPIPENTVNTVLETVIKRGWMNTGRREVLRGRKVRRRPTGSKAYLDIREMCIFAITCLVWPRDASKLEAGQTNTTQPRPAHCERLVGGLVMSIRESEGSVTPGPLIFQWRDTSPLQ